MSRFPVFHLIISVVYITFKVETRTPDSIRQRGAIFRHFSKAIENFGRHEKKINQEVNANRIQVCGPQRFYTMRCPQVLI